jgi:hypothetical protein
MSALSLYSDTCRTSKATAVKTDLAGGFVDFYTGSMPADGNTAPGGTLLSTHSLASPCGTVTNGVLTFTLPANVAIAATGTAAVARFRKSDGSHYASANVGATSGFCVVLGSTAFQQGAYSAITSLTWTEPATGA